MNLNLLTELFQYWIDATWYIAFLMSFGVNCAVYIFTAFFISSVLSKLKSIKRIGFFINEASLNSRQVRSEIKYGVGACFMFAFASLFTRFFFVDIWPDSFFSFLVQIIIFSIFYETYSYFIHRLLHHKLLRSAHSVHHRSVRVNPWSAYSVHPIEAFFIGISAPIFMFIFPMSLGVILVLHIMGMIFTMIIHSNFMLNESVKFSSIFNKYTVGHSLHHQKGDVNFGFVHVFWDKVFKTEYNSR